MYPTGNMEEAKKGQLPLASPRASALALLAQTYQQSSFLQEGQVCSSPSYAGEGVSFKRTPPIIFQIVLSPSSKRGPV